MLLYAKCLLPVVIHRYGVNVICCKQVFMLTDMKSLRKKSCLLTGYYELLLKNLSPDEPDTQQQPPAKRNKSAGSYIASQLATVASSCCNCRIGNKVYSKVPAFQKPSTVKS